MQVFGERYARYYDALYTTKDYEGECNFLEEVFNRFASERPRRLLDVGCGTGGYAIPLGKRGYIVKGIDLSSSMIALAKEKAKRENVEVDFEEMDIRRLRMDETFDVCTCMFAVIDYLLEDDDIENSFRAVRSHLREKSLFVFDFWNGNAVLSVLPSLRTTRAIYQGREITRTATPTLDRTRNLCDVHYRCTVRIGARVIEEFEETHSVRYLFPEEIGKRLRETGFELRYLCPFPDLNGKIRPDTWNLAAVAIAK